MAASLLEQVTSLASPEVVERLAGALGETPQATDRALTGAAMPAVLGGLAQQFSGGAGPARLLGLIKQQDPGGRLLDNVQADLSGATPGHLSGGLGGAAPGQSFAEVQHAGQGVIGTLFGQRSDQVADAVATHAGVRKTSAMSLLSIAGAMVMGWLGHKVARGGLDATDLGAMLSHASGEVGRIAPPGLAAAIGASGVAGAVREPGREAAREPVREPVREPAREPVRDTAGKPERERTYAASAAGAQEAIYRDEAAGRRKAGPTPAARRGLSWLIPLLVVLGLAAWLISRFHGRTPTAPTPQVTAPAAPTVTPPHANAPAGPTATTPQATGPATPAMRAPAGPNANAPNANAPTLNAPTQPVQLPSGARLNLPTTSAAFGIASFLGHPNAGPASQRFTLRNMNFPTAGSTVSPQAQNGLNDLAAILRAYPHATVQIQGFTDNVGSPQANLALSQQRANAVRMALIQRGVAPNRVSAQGFGGNNPVANNATETGRFLNRRTDLVVSR